MAAQPFYHRVDGLLFTTTTGMGEERFLAGLKNYAKELASWLTQSKSSPTVTPNLNLAIPPICKETT